MAFDVGPKKGVAPTINVTPLVDVVLVLLIIFMVVTPMLIKQMSFAVPPKPDDTEQPPPPDAAPPVVLVLGKDGQARVNDEVIPREELVSRLNRMLNARADKVVFFDAQAGVPWGQALALLDEVKGGGVENVAVLSEEVGAEKTE